MADRVAWVGADGLSDVRARRRGFVRQVDQLGRSRLHAKGELIGINACFDFGIAVPRAGIVRVYDINDMFECAELLARRRVPKGPRLAIITNAGGPAIIATDALVNLGMRMAELSENSLEALSGFLPAEASVANPIDMIASANATSYRKALEILLEDDGVDRCRGRCAGRSSLGSPGRLRAPRRAARGRRCGGRRRHGRRDRRHPVQP